MTSFIELYFKYKYKFLTLTDHFVIFGSLTAHFPLYSPLILISHICLCLPFLVSFINRNKLDEYLYSKYGLRLLISKRYIQPTFKALWKWNVHNPTLVFILAIFIYLSRHLLSVILTFLHKLGTILIIIIIIETISPKRNNFMDEERRASRISSLLTVFWWII